MAASRTRAAATESSPGSSSSCLRPIRPIEYLGPKTIWMQLSVRNDAAAARAEAKGVQVVMNRCPKIEWGRLSGEISWGGINSRILSAKKPTMMTGFQKLSVDKED